MDLTNSSNTTNEPNSSHHKDMDMEFCSTFSFMICESICYFLSSEMQKIFDAINGSRQMSLHEKTRQFMAANKGKCLIHYDALIPENPLAISRPLPVHPNLIDFSKQLQNIIHNCQEELFTHRNYTMFRYSPLTYTPRKLNSSPQLQVDRCRQALLDKIRQELTANNGNFNLEDLINSLTRPKWPKKVFLPNLTKARKRPATAVLELVSTPKSNEPPINEFSPNSSISPSSSFSARIVRSNTPLVTMPVNIEGQLRLSSDLDGFTTKTEARNLKGSENVSPRGKLDDSQ